MAHLETTPPKPRRPAFSFRTVGGRVPLLAVVLFLLALLPYLHGMGNSFIELDDPESVTENSMVRNGLTREGVGWALTTFHMGNWQPLTWLSHMADVSLFGLDPRGHHLVNYLLHALNTSLLFVALSRLTVSVWPSALVAALFGVHPLHVESVAWVAERKDLLAGLFFMLVLLSWERYIRRGGVVRILGAALLLALGLSAKPMLVTVPFVLLLLDVWPLGRTAWAAPADGGERAPVPWGRLLLEKTPLLALSAASSVVTFLAQRESGTVVALTSIPWGTRVANAVVSYAAYLHRTVWPADLAVFYPYPRGGHPSLQVIGSLFLLAALSWVVFSRSRRAPFLAVGWFWYLGMLVPVIGLVQVGSQTRADRYTYLPLVGVFIAVAWGIPWILAGRWRRAVAAVACAAVALLTSATWVQVGHWRNSETLFKHTLSHTSDNWLIGNNLGGVLAREGRYDEAASLFREVLRIRPGDPIAHNNLGSTLFRIGKLDEAVVEYREALRLKPDYPDAHSNLASLLWRMGRREEARQHLEEARRWRASARPSGETP